MSPAELLRRHALLVHAGSALVAIGSLVAISAYLPASRALLELRGWIEHLGVLGPLALLVLYVLVSLLVLPGFVVIVLAGAVLPPLVALGTMSVATALAAVAGYLVARHVAHGPIERLASRSHRVDAVREAMAEGGFGILVLLRLTPVVPYGFANYLFGLTPVRLAPFVAASWIAMIPTVLLYALLGHTGGESLVAVQSGLELSGGGPLGMALVALGFGLRWLGVLYVARRTRQRLARAERTAPRPAAPRPTSGAGLPLVSAAGAGLLLAGAVGAFLARDLLVSLPGPDPVTMREAYAEAGGALSFDHGLFDELLQAHVDEQGFVDYAALAADSSRLDRYIEALAAAPFDRLARDEKLALLINAYNAFTLRLVLDHWPLKSILEIPFDRRWEGRRWNVGGHSWTLSQIEHEQCRGSFVEPRVHFALNCASVGCPPLWGRAYRGADLDAQLEARTRHVHQRRRWFQLVEQDLPERIDLEVGLTRLYAWYRGDFEQVAGKPLAYAARYSPRLAQALESGETVKIRWLPYDWSLNGIEARERQGTDQP